MTVYALLTNRLQIGILLSFDDIAELFSEYLFPVLYSSLGQDNIGLDKI